MSSHERPRVSIEFPGSNEVRSLILAVMSSHGSSQVAGMEDQPTTIEQARCDWSVAAIAFWSVPMTTRPAQKPKYAQNLLSVNIFELGP